MLTHWFKRYVLVSYNTGYFLMDTHLKESTETCKSVASALSSNLGSGLPLQSDIENVITYKKYTIVKESAYPITRQTDPELFL